MSNTKRPSLERKQTRASKAKVADALDSGIRIELDGRAYEVRMGDMTALDSRALRLEFGMSFPRLCAALSDDADIDLIAAVLWLARRTNGEPGLSYEAVAAEVGYDVMDRIEVSDPGADEGSTSDPEG